MPRSAIPPSAGKRGLNMNFNHEELMLMMLYNTGTRMGLIHELRLMQCYLMIVNQLIRRVDVYRGYQINISFNFDLTPYIEGE